jgi:hypothetical protein
MVGSIDGLPSNARAAIGAIWSGRAASELRVGTQFELLGECFARHQADTGVRALLSHAAADEARHAAICVSVAEQYAGAQELAPPERPGALTRFGDADEFTSLILHLVLLSCVNEVTSTFYLLESMQRSRSTVARAALRQLLSDDVKHARIGWAFLASSSATIDAKRHVAAALPTLLRLSHYAWTDVPERTEPWFADHGCLGQSVARGAFEQAVRDVVLPGMASVGVDPTPGASWFEQSRL